MITGEAGVPTRTPASKRLCDILPRRLLSCVGPTRTHSPARAMKHGLGDEAFILALEGRESIAGAETLQQTFLLQDFGMRGQPGVAQQADAGNIVGRFFFSSRRRHTRFDCDWSSDVCSSD